MIPLSNLKHLPTNALQEVVDNTHEAIGRNRRSGALMGFVTFLVGMGSAITPIFVTVEFPMQITLIICTAILLAATFVCVHKWRKLENYCFPIQRELLEREKAKLKAMAADAPADVPDELQAKVAEILDDDQKE